MIDDILVEAKKRFNDIYTGDYVSQREKCRSDRLFTNQPGSQWDGDMAKQFENKPKMEINKIQMANTRITNEYRNNRITVRFVSRTGDSGDELADACNDLFRADEQDSKAQEAYDNAFDEAISGGMGGLRLCAEYEDEYNYENEHQRIKIEPIYDADNTIYFDPDAKQFDKSDAKFCFVLNGMSVEKFKEEYGQDPTTWPKEDTYTNFEWWTKEVVYIAEYYKVNETTEKFYFFQHLTTGEEKVINEENYQDTEKLLELQVSGYQEINSRRVKKREIIKYVLSGNTVLEDKVIIPGKCIPVIPTYGKRFYINNIERFVGNTAYCRDPQMLYNMQVSSLAETAAISPVETPIVTPDQIAGHQNQWNDNNIKNYAYLMLNPIKDATGNLQPLGPIGYTKSPVVPPALSDLVKITDYDIKEVLGNREQAEKMNSNMSGKAIELVQSAIDFQSFIYIDNMAKSIRRVGEIWLSMAKELYVEDGRKMKGIGEKDEITTIELNKPYSNIETGEIEYKNDFSKINYDVAVDIGPSYTSRRSSTLNALVSVLQYAKDQESIEILTGMIMMNMEGEGVESVREYYRRKMVMRGIEKPTEEEQKELEALAQNQQPDPNTILLQATAANEQAKAEKAKADAVKTYSEVDKIEAETVDILTDIQRKDKEAATSLINGSNNQ